MSSNRYHYDTEYCETTTLADGTEVLLRLIHAGDRELLRRAFAALSPETRYARFFMLKGELSEAELTALTVLDGVNHVAFGAVGSAPQGPKPLGVARFIRAADQPDLADAAVVVVDAFQTRGLGTILLQRLAAAARERGIVRFRADFFLRNDRIRHLIESLATIGRYETDGEIVHVEVPVPDISPGTPPSTLDRASPLYRLFGHSATGAIQMQIDRGRLTRKE